MNAENNSETHDNGMTRLFSATSATAPNASSSLLASCTVGTPPAWALPVYGPIPHEWRATLLIAATMGGSAPDSGLSRMEFLTEVKSAHDVADGVILIIPLRCPLEGEPADYSYLGKAGIALVITRGAASTHTGVRFLGCHAGTIPPDVQPGDHLRFDTPSRFLVAKEELLQLGHQMAAALAGWNGKRNRAALEDGEGVPASAGGQASAGGASSQGERNSYLLYDPLGRAHQTRVKSDLIEREKQLAVVFRATSADRWRYIMGSEFLLEIQQYRDFVIEQYAAKAGERQPGFMSCGLYDRVNGLALSQDVDQLGMLLRGQFGGSEPGALGLHNFLGEGTSLPTGSDPCLMNNAVMVTALKNLELVLRVYLAEEFKGATDRMVDSLEGVDRPLELAPAGYLLSTVEAVLAKWFRRMRESGTQGLTGPQECSDALRQALSSFLADVDTQPKLSEAVARYNLNIRRERSVGKEASTTTKLVKPKSGLICQYFVAGHLNVRDDRTKSRFLCSHRRCANEHPAKEELTSTRLKAIIDTFPSPRIRDLCTRALEPRARPTKK